MQVQEFAYKKIRSKISIIEIMVLFNQLVLFSVNKLSHFPSMTLKEVFLLIVRNYLSSLFFKIMTMRKLTPIFRFHNSTPTDISLFLLFFLESLLMSKAKLNVISILNRNEMLERYILRLTCTI